MEHVIKDQWFASEVSRLIEKLEPHKTFFADVKSSGGTASIVIQFMDGFLAEIGQRNGKITFDELNQLSGRD
jgi:hypothetical protein